MEPNITTIVQQKSSFISHTANMLPRKVNE